MKKTKILSFSYVLLYLLVYLFRNEENSLKILFYGFFFVLMLVLLTYFGMRSKYELANFYGGVLIAFVLLLVFNALPYIEGWTRHGSYLQERFDLPLPLHHSTLALLAVPWIALLQCERKRLPSNLRFRVPFSRFYVDLIFLLWGCNSFLFISQVPEIIIYGTLFF